MDWADLAQDRVRWRALVNAVINLSGTIKCGEFLTSREPVSCSRRTLLRGLSIQFFSRLRYLTYCAWFKVKNEVVCPNTYLCV